MSAKDKNLKIILDSIQDDPVQFRKPQYLDPEYISLTKLQLLRHLDFITTGDAHQIHHLKEKGYVERPVRVPFIVKGLNKFMLIEHKVKHFGEKWITAVHEPSLLKFLKKAEMNLGPGQLLYPNVFPIRKSNLIPKNWEMQAGYFCIDTFTPVTSNAYKAARNAVNAALTGAECVLKGSQHCYVLCRPPGHHAESRVFGGFCYFNNAAIAAHYLSKHGKVAVLDIDYHHGNGTQEIFYSRDDVYFISIHGHPSVSYPYFAGYSTERGKGKGRGFNRNYPLYPGIDDNQYCKVLAEALILIKRFKPNFIVLSLGLDIMAGDPTGNFKLTPEGLYQIGKMLKDLQSPILIVQEGGYALKNLKQGVQAFFKGLLGKEG